MSALDNFFKHLKNQSVPGPSGAPLPAAAPAPVAAPAPDDVPAPAPAQGPADVFNKSLDKLRQEIDQAKLARIQKVLQQLGHYHDKIDGVMGPNTRAAIKDFQKAYSQAL